MWQLCNVRKARDKQSIADGYSQVKSNCSAPQGFFMLLWIKSLTPAPWAMALHYHQVSFTQIWMYFSSHSKHDICPTWNSGMVSNSEETSPLQETIHSFSLTEDWIIVKWYYFDRRQMWFLTHPNRLQQISILSSKYLVYKLSPHLEVYHCNSGKLES